MEIAVSEGKKMIEEKTCNQDKKFKIKKKQIELNYGGSMYEGVITFCQIL